MSCDINNDNNFEVEQVLSYMSSVLRNVDYTLSRRDSEMVV